MIKFNGVFNIFKKGNNSHAKTSVLWLFFFVWPIVGSIKTNIKINSDTFIFVTFLILIILNNLTRSCYCITIFDMCTVIEQFFNIIMLLNRIEKVIILIC